MRRCNPMMDFYVTLWGYEFPLRFSIRVYHMLKYLMRRRYERRAYRQYIDHLLPF